MAISLKIDTELAFRHSFSKKHNLFSGNSVIFNL